MLERLADSGLLAGINSGLEEFDDNFSALTRPDVMTMVANLMMLLGLLRQLPYEGGFKLAMGAPEVIGDAYPRFRDRTEPMSFARRARSSAAPTWPARWRCWSRCFALSEDERAARGSRHSRHRSPPDAARASPAGPEADGRQRRSLRGRWNLGQDLSVPSSRLGSARSASWR